MNIYFVIRLHNVSCIIRAHGSIYLHRTSGLFPSHSQQLTLMILQPVHRVEIFDRIASMSCFTSDRYVAQDLALAILLLAATAIFRLHLHLYMMCHLLASQKG